MPMAPSRRGIRAQRGQRDMTAPPKGNEGPLSLKQRLCQPSTRAQG
jgi:hypothetical protein